MNEDDERTPEDLENFRLKRKELFKFQLRSRATRLLKLMELDAPKQILANEVGLISQACVSLCPDEMGIVIGEMIGRYVASTGLDTKKENVENDEGSSQ